MVFFVKLKKTTRQNNNVKKKKKRLAGIKANKEKNSTLKFLSVSPNPPKESKKKRKLFFVLFCVFLSVGKLRG